MLLDYDPLNGISTHFEYNDREQKMILTAKQDVSLIRDTALALSSDMDRSKKGIKNDNWHYARVPLTILQEMKTKHNADWYDKNDTKHRHFFKVLNDHYRDFKTTTLVHN